MHALAQAQAQALDSNVDKASKFFITEVDNGSPATQSCKRSITSVAVPGKANGSSEIRHGELVSNVSSSSFTGENGGGGASEVFRIVDKLGEKQLHSKSIRTIIQKAAQKTILVVRTKNATQAADSVTIRFHKAQVTEIPRSVQLRDVCDKVLHNVSVISPSKKKKQRSFQKIFVEATEVDTLLKDMFWYLTAHCFQKNKHLQVEESFYQRIADTFTSLFIRLQMHPTTRDSGFFDMLPDVIAQILFMSLYEAFPRSRKAMLSDELRRQILQICHRWICGFVPVELSWSHWIPVDQESPKRLAALAEFPAMRNRMLRAERVEKTKLYAKNRQDQTSPDLLASDLRDESAPNDADTIERDKLPHLQGTQSSSNHHTNVQMETRERCVYEMCNSPLIETFLKRHQLESNANHLRTQLRMSGVRNADLHHQGALHAIDQPRDRRRRIVDPKSYAEALTQIESFGDAVRQTYAHEKKKTHDRDVLERKKSIHAQRELEAQLGELKQHSEQLHAFSNLLVSKSRIDALTATNGTAENTPNIVRTSPPFKPRPPPARGNR